MIEGRVDRRSGGDRRSEDRGGFDRRLITKGVRQLFIQSAFVLGCDEAGNIVAVIKPGFLTAPDRLLGENIFDFITHAGMARNAMAQFQYTRLSGIQTRLTIAVRDRLGKEITYIKVTSSKILGGRAGPEMMIFANTINK